MTDADEPAEQEMVSVDAVEELIEDVQAEVLEEDKMGATREMMVEGTCQRISSRLNTLDTNPA